MPCRAMQGSTPSMLCCNRRSYQSRPPRRRIYSPMPLSVVPGAAQLFWMVSVTAYLAASLSVCPLKARERAAAHRARSTFTCKVWHIRFVQRC